MGATATYVTRPVSGLHEVIQRPWVNAGKSWIPSDCGETTGVVCSIRSISGRDRFITRPVSGLQEVFQRPWVNAGKSWIPSDCRVTTAVEYSMRSILSRFNSYIKKPVAGLQKVLQRPWVNASKSWISSNCWIKKNRRCANFPHRFYWVKRVVAVIRR